MSTKTFWLLVRKSVMGCDAVSLGLNIVNEPQDVVQVGLSLWRLESLIVGLQVMNDVIQTKTFEASVDSH